MRVFHIFKTKSEFVFFGKSDLEKNVFKHVSGKIRKVSLAHIRETARTKPYGEFLQRRFTILSITLTYRGGGVTPTDPKGKEEEMLF
jgi:hypothetical protein